MSSRRGGYRPNPNAEVPERITPPSPPVGVGGGSRPIRAIDQELLDARRYANDLLKLLNRAEAELLPLRKLFAAVEELADDGMPGFAGSRYVERYRLCALLDDLRQHLSPETATSAAASDMDPFDHAAEHYAMTGSDVCWCAFPECERRAKDES